MKKTMIKKTVTAVLFCISCAFASAFSLNELVSTKNAEKLELKGKVQKKRMNEETLSLKLVPSSPLSKKFKGLWPKSKSDKPVLIGENLYLIKKTDLDPENPDRVTIQKASEILRSISTMQGLKYYSNTDEEWKTLYKDAYLIDNLKNKKKIADEISGSADGRTAYCLLNDNSLGKTYYSVKYRQTEDEVSVQFENQTSISYAFITAVDEENVKIGLNVMDCGDSLLIYALVEAKFPSFSFLENKLNKSFSARVDAIYNWFINEFKNNRS